MIRNQLELIKIYKKYLNNCRNKKIDISTSALCYQTSWVTTPGYYKLLSFLGKKPIGGYFHILKDLLSVSRYFDLELQFNNNIKNNKYKYLVVSYCTKKNFDKTGEFYDQFFNFNSKDKNFFWLLISLDNNPIKKIKENICIIAKKRKNSFSIIFLLKKIFSIFFLNILTLQNIPHKLSSYFLFSERIELLLNYLSKYLKFNKVILNYEGIPFQNNIINFYKKKNKKIKNYCYFHCAGWPLQLDLYFRNSNVDKLIVSGEDQKHILQNKLGWPKKKITSIPSLRFKAGDDKYNGYIFIPYDLTNADQYLIKFKNFLKSLQGKNFSKFKIRIHPLNKESELHKNFSLKILNIMNQNKQCFKKKKNNFSIIFGSPTGVTLQALESGTKIIHFPNNELLDVFSSKLWKNVKVKKINQEVFQYSVINKNKLFYQKKQNKRFMKYFKPLLS